MLGVPTYEGAPRVHENAKRGDARLPARREKRCGYAKNGINRPPPHFNGKEGVDGSSPSEGLKYVQIGYFCCLTRRSPDVGYGGGQLHGDLQGFFFAVAVHAR